jgi:Mrp family chromosome partitioning ATPase
VDPIVTPIERARRAGVDDEAAAAPRRQAEPEGQGAAVQYSRTRTVQVAAETLRARRITGGHEKSPLADAYKQLRTQVLRRLNAEGWNALGVASPRRGEGKTTVALNLAVHVAQEIDRTVLLVDADLRRPGLCETLGIPGLKGLSDCLTAYTPIETLLINPGFGRCVLLPAGAPIENSSELLGSPRMRELAHELKRRYPDRLVIFDVPPLLESADGLAMLPLVEALLMVVEEGGTPAEDLVRAAQLAGGTRLIGTVLNKSREPLPPQRQRPQGRGGWLRRLVGDAER